MIFNDPASLIDCPKCDGQFFPSDPKCSSCGYKNPNYWDFDKTKEMIDAMKRYGDLKE